MNLKIKWFIIFIIVLFLSIANLIVGIAEENLFNMFVCGLTTGGMAFVLVGYLLEKKERKHLT